MPRSSRPSFSLRCMWCSRGVHTQYSVSCHFLRSSSVLAAGRLYITRFFLYGAQYVSGHSCTRIFDGFISSCCGDATAHRSVVGTISRLIIEVTTNFSIKNRRFIWMDGSLIYISLGRNHIFPWSSQHESDLGAGFQRIRVFSGRERERKIFVNLPMPGGVTYGAFAWKLLRGKKIYKVEIVRGKTPGRML